MVGIVGGDDDDDDGWYPELRVVVCVILELMAGKSELFTVRALCPDRFSFTLWTKISKIIL